MEGEMVTPHSYLGKTRLARYFLRAPPPGHRARAPKHGAGAAASMQETFVNKILYRRDREHFRGVPVSKTIEDAGQPEICRLSPESRGLHSSIGFPVATFSRRREWPHQS